VSTRKRVADLQPGDLTQHAGGACTCGDPSAPFRVEELDRSDNGRAIEVTWSHPPCGETCQPLGCSPDCLVTFFGRSDQ
jgi:hypothetical protein